MRLRLSPALERPSERWPIHYPIQFHRIVPQPGEQGGGSAADEFCGIALDARIRRILRQQVRKDDASDLQIVGLSGKESLQRLVKHANAIGSDDDEWKSKGTSEIGDVLPLS